MKSKARFLPFAGALILLASLFMFSAASAQTVGTVKLSKSFITTPDGELKITVEDADLNTGVIQKDEERGRSRRGVGTEAYVIPAGNYSQLQLVTFRTAKAPIKSASPRELYGISTLSATDTDIREDYQDVVVKLTGTYGADQVAVEAAWRSLTSQTTIQDTGIPSEARHPYSLENAAGGAFTLGITDGSANVNVPVPITFSVTYKAPDLQDASVKLTSTTDSTGVQVKVPETGDDTAKFERTFQTATAPQTTHIVDLSGGVREDQITLNLDGSGCEPGPDGSCMGSTAGDDPLVRGTLTSQRYGRSTANDALHITRDSVATTTEVSIGIDLTGDGSYQRTAVNWIDVRQAPDATIPPGARLGWRMNPAPASGTDTQKKICEDGRKYLRLSAGRYVETTVLGGEVQTRTDAEGDNVRICWTGTDVRIAAAPGSRITATYADDGGTPRTANATVETVKPTITIKDPKHNTATRVRSARLIAEITDADSGVDNGNNNVNIVFDVTPRNLAGGSVAGPGVTVSAVTTVSIPGGYRAEASLVNVPPGETEIKWKVIARDNAGNVAQSDQDPTDGPLVVDDPATPANETEAEGANTTEPDLHTLRIDTIAPLLGTVSIDYDGSGNADPKTVNGAITGNYLDDDTNNIVTDATKGRNTSIRVVFNEDLDASKVVPSDFRVNGVAPIAAATKGRNVFLTVPTFASDARPSVRLSGEIQDKAGNVRPGGLIVEEAQDGISPTVTVTLNPASGYDQEQATIEVRSSEALLTAPVIRLSSKGQDDGDDGPMAGQTGLSAATLTEDARLYRATFKPTVQPFRYNVNVDVLDTSANPRSVGKAKADTDDAITIEIDKSLPAQTSVTLPGLDPITSIDSKTTYKITRQNPFITIEWDSEAKEYGRITDNKGTKATSDDTDELTNDASDIAAVADDPNKSFKSLDTHGAVDVTNLKLKIGVDTFDVDTPMGDTPVARSVVKVDDDTSYDFVVTKPTKNRLLISVRGLQIGTYEMSFNGQDELGNTLKNDVKIKFEIKAPDPFKLDLVPGWNLVSIPSLLTDTAIDTVIPADHPATQVYTYDPTEPGGWLNATRLRLDEVAEGEARVFDGSLKQITGSVAYWIFTDSFEKLEIPFDSAVVRANQTIRQVPQVNLLQGWNLIPILDITGAKKFGDDLNTPTAYLRGDVLRAYGYSTSTNRYTTVADDANLRVGYGYWVYMTKAKVIVP